MRPLPVRLFSIVLLAFVLAGCDATGSSDTVILNESSPTPPTVEYTFEYTPDDVNQGGEVVVTSDGSDDLGTVLQDNGFSRSNVVSASVDRVELFGRSPQGSSAKIYNYVRRAQIYFPESASSPVAEGEISTPDGPAQVSLDVTNGEVTEAVKEGAQRALLRMDTQQGGFSELYRAEARVYFRIELEGV